MYPRVKVRDIEEMKVMLKVEMSCTVRAMSSLSLEKDSPKVLIPTTDVQDYSQSNGKISMSPPTSSNGKKKNNYNKEHKAKIVNDQKCEDNHILPLARTPISNSKISSKPLTVVPKSKDDSALHDGINTKIKTSLVPRPRAVLSSPENDEIIGSQNQLVPEKQIVLRKQAHENDRVVIEKKLLHRRLTPNQDQNGRCKARSAEKNCESTGTFIKEAGSNSVMKRNHSSAPRQRPPFKF